MMDERPFDLALAGAMAQAMPGIVTEAIKSSLCLALAFSLVIVVGYFGRDALLLLVATTVALPLLGAAWRQGELSWNIGAARIAALRPPAPAPPRLLVFRGSNVQPTSSDTVRAEDMLWLAEEIYVHNRNWARRDLCTEPPLHLPSGRLLSEDEYDRLMNALVAQGLIVGRSERDKGEKGVDSWNEAQRLLEEIAA